MPNLDLDPAGAEADVAAMQAAQRHIEDLADQMKTVHAQLFGGTLVGSGADAGSDYAHRLDSAVRSSSEVVQLCAQVVGRASSDTEAFDKAEFAGNYA